MTAWAIWFELAGLAIAVELFFGTFYLLMIAIGFVVGGVVALCGGPLEWQLLVAALVAIIAVTVLRRSRFGRRATPEPTSNPDINADIGQTIHVEHWRQSDQLHIARARYRGAEWDVELASGSPVQSGNFIIREVRGSRLIVSHS